MEEGMLLATMQPTLINQIKLADQNMGKYDQNMGKYDQNMGKYDQTVGNHATYTHHNFANQIRSAGQNIGKYDQNIGNHAASTHQPD